MSEDINEKRMLAGIVALDSLFRVFEFFKNKETSTLIDYDSDGNPEYIGTFPHGENYQLPNCKLEKIIYDSAGRPRYILTAVGKHRWVDRKNTKYFYQNSL